MADLLAVVSKAVFERALREADLSEGVVWPTTSYASTNKGLAPLARGGRLFLVTVRPPDEALWLVAVLDQPKLARAQWVARTNTTPIRDVSGLRGEIRFASGAGLPAKAGVLGMSLQTPRELTADTAALLASAKGATRNRPRAAAPPRKQPRAKRAAQVPATVALDQDALLANWQKTRSPRVADVLQHAPVDDKWTARLAAIAKGPTSRAIRDRLFKLPDDPRVTVFLIECLRKARWPGASGDTIWSLIFKRLVALADQRALAPLREAAARPPYFLGARHTAWIVSQLVATADALERVTTKRKPDDAATNALVAAQPVAPPKAGWLVAANPIDDALVQDVWAAPDDDAVRSVVADALLERNDPWGELISLQLLGGTKHRDEVAKLLRKHAARFAGPIAKVSTQRDMVFERGFLASCLIERGMIGRRVWEEVANAPHWATVHTVDIGIFHVPRWWPGAWYSAAPLASLRKIIINNVELTRATATAAWAVTKAPQRVEWHTREALVSVVKGMPVTERARISVPSSKGVRDVLAGCE